MKKFDKLNKLKIFILIIPILLGVIYAFNDFIIDYMWFKELGYLSAFFKKMFTQIKIGIPVFIVITAVSYIYFKSIKKSYFEKVALYENTNSKIINRVSLAMGIIVGGVSTYIATKKLWFSALQFANSTDFGYDDPMFNFDISFYIFKLDFIKDITMFLVFLLVFYLIGTVAYYFILLGVRPPKIFKETKNEFEEYDRFDEKSNRRFSKPFNVNLNNENIKNIFLMAKKQVMIATALIFVLVAVYFNLKQFELLQSHRGVVYGAGYTDVTITLWAYRVAMGISLIGAILVVIGIKKEKLKLIIIPPVAIGIVLALNVVGGMALQYAVSSDEIAKESKYLERNIEYTQKAYGLDEIDIKDFNVENNLTANDIKNNQPTISNIRINDYMPTEKFYNQTQSIRQYYTFKDVDVDRYMINGEYTQTFLSAREIDEEKLNQTWLNKHLKYTHGYGITLSRVDSVTSTGQPHMLIKNIPPKSDASEIEIKRPEIYFGEITDNYAVVGTTEEEFDYPDGDNNKYTKYEGTAGIKLNFINRVLFALKEQSLKMLISPNINKDSKIIINRNIMDRAKKIMPYLTYDDEPYMITENGRLYWIIDAYTSSENFPYSEPYKLADKQINYVRNSVKVVIDAYNGDVDYYVVDEKDPIANTFKKIYPKLFKTFEDMPKEIRSHIRYPNALFATQAQVYNKYHMEDARVLYQDEDRWYIAKEIYGTEEQSMNPSYYIMNLPGEQHAEFVNIIPFTPKKKTNMTAIMVARNDGANYGKIVLYKLPKNKFVYGPRQIEAQIDQDPEISKDFSLWNSSGSKYSRGNMFVIPIENSILYVEPIYLEASESSIPEVKRVIVAYGDKIAYEKTLAGALNKLFGEGASQVPTQSVETETGNDTEDSQKNLIEKANNAYKSALDAQKKGEWAKYGEYMKELEGYLQKLQ